MYEVHIIFVNMEIRIKDPLLRAYLDGLFDKRDGVYLATMDTATGCVICSLAQISARPCHHDNKDESVVEFILPNSHHTSDKRNKFLYVSPNAEKQINAVLAKEFDTNFVAFCLQYKTMGIQLQTTIDIFIVENNMDDFFAGSVETLKKRFYRYEVSKMKNLREILRQKAYYAFRKAVKRTN